MKLLVVGVGNVLLRDDGLGVRVVEELAKKQWPPEVELLDGGTAGLDLLYLLEGADRVILVDSLQAGDVPGSIYRFEAGELDGFVKGAAMSLHQVGVLEVLELGRILGKLPPTVVVGVQPADLGQGMELSPPLQEALPRVCRAVEAEIERTSWEPPLGPRRSPGPEKWG